MSTPSGPPRSAFFICLIVAILTIVTLGFLESRSSNASTTPAPSPAPLRLIHTHGSTTPDAGSTRRETAPTAVATVSPDKRPQAAIESPSASDDGHEDLLERRRAIFDAWWPTSDDWALADTSLKSCTRVQFIHSFVGTEPEDAMDDCLDRLDQEAAEHASSRTRKVAQIPEDFE